MFYLAMRKFVLLLKNRAVIVFRYLGVEVVCVCLFC